jgi:hypothetical protein
MRSITKKLFAFIIMMFSISLLQAQICKGDKVLMHIGGTKYRCQSMCIPSSQVNKYLLQGWFYGSCPPIFPGAFRSIGKVSSKKIPDKPLLKISADNAIASR